MTHCQTACRDSLKMIALLLAILLGFIVQTQTARAETLRTAVVAGGCFWCVEADFEKVNGGREVVSGFAGGSVPNPSYDQVVRGGTGHLEVVEITYDAEIISYDQLLWLFMRSIDPTDGGGQFCDRGPTYRTAAFPAGNAERQSAQNAIRAAEQALGQRVATEILAGQFYPADEYHQDYYRSSGIVLTRAGPKSKANAYAFYREACGRDDRVRALWGADAPFAG